MVGFITKGATAAKGKKNWQTNPGENRKMEGNSFWEEGWKVEIPRTEEQSLRPPSAPIGPSAHRAPPLINVSAEAIAVPESRWQSLPILAHPTVLHNRRTYDRFNPRKPRAASSHPSNTTELSFHHPRLRSPPSGTISLSLY